MTPTPKASSGKPPTHPRGHDLSQRITNEIVPISLIDFHPENYNEHPQEQVNDLEASYKELGQFRSFILWRRPGGRFTQIGGEGTVRGMQQAHAREVRADVWPEDTPPEIVKQIMLADNLHARNGLLNQQKLAELLQEQADLDQNLAALGSGEDELQAILTQLADEALSQDTLPADEDDDERGLKLALIHATIGEPAHTVAAGDCYRVTDAACPDVRHTVLCLHPFTEWPHWLPLFSQATTSSPRTRGEPHKILFLPFAGPFALLAEVAQETALFVLQPDPYIAGHILDRYAETHPGASITLTHHVAGLLPEEDEEEEEDDDDERV